MRCLIIDDERLAREELKSLLKHYGEIEIIGEAKNATEGIELIKKENPDLIFLDIQMPEMNGFEMLKQLDEIPQVIFITAYDEYAIDAFKVKALDYLLKPVHPNELKNTIERLEITQNEDDFTSTSHPQFDRKDRQLTISDSVFIKDNEKCFFPKLQDIRYFESHGNYIKVYFLKHKPMILRSLNSLEERLDPNHFFRANRKYIINLNYIENIENWFNGGLQVTLSEDVKIEISRRQAIKFKEIMSF
ncbi:MAG: response regulator transcription factor [Crocinitomicaceae bacterium]|nr:response regulator transcription factor [Crocinitomicaceae bacterium]